MAGATKAEVFTDSDWYAWAGCNTWPSGAQPVIRRGDDWIAVCDPHGFEIYRCDENGEYELFKSGKMQVPNQAIALLLLNGLPDVIDWTLLAGADFEHNEFV